MRDGFGAPQRLHDAARDADGKQAAQQQGHGAQDPDNAAVGVYPGVQFLGPPRGREALQPDQVVQGVRELVESIFGL